MGFQEWLAHLRADGYQLCPASTSVPIELRGLLPDGRGFHLSCRGVRVRLAVYRAGRASWQVPVVAPTARPEEAVSEWERRPLRTWDDRLPGATVVFGGPPDAQAVWDGGVERGWRGHEAGLLRPAEAAGVFARLLDVVPGERGGRIPRARDSVPMGATTDAVSWRSFQGV